MKTVIAIFLCLLFAFPLYAVETQSPPPAPDREALLSALFEADIPSLRKALDLKLISSRELTEYYLERIEAYNDTYNCFITLCDNAVSEAELRDQAMAEGAEVGPLFGIPVVVKDNIKYKGYMTTNGHWPDYNVSSENADVVQALLDAGAVIVGKTNMSTEAREALYSSSDFIGETFNAYNTDMSAGGSSGGSSVAVSLNFSVAGLGTDTNASLRYPAVLNGCISLRPTHGLLSLDGCIPLLPWRDTPGAITRTVTDQAIMLDALTGNSYYESLNPDALQGARLGVLKELAYACDTGHHRQAQYLDSEIQATFSNAIEELTACGATVFDISIPNLYALFDQCEEESTSAKAELHSIYQSLFEEHDLDGVIFPTYLHTPQYSLTNTGWTAIHEEDFLSNCNKLSSPIGIPEIAIPIGYHSRGVGIGLEIAALSNQEQELLDLAFSYTRSYDHRLIPEGAANLYSSDFEGDLSAFIDSYLLSLNPPEPETTEPPVSEPSETETKPVSTEVEPSTAETEAVSETASTIPPVSQSGDTPSSDGPPPIVIIGFSIIILCCIGIILCLVYYIKKTKTE